MFLLVNDSAGKFSISPDHSLFNLDVGDWTICTVEDSLPKGDIDGLRDLAKSYVPQGYEEIAFDTLVPPVGWVLRSDYRVFLSLYKNQYKATMRLGQAFLYHFRDRFPEAWPQLFYCEDDSLSQAMLNEKVF